MFWCSSMCLCVSVVHSLLLLNTVLLYKYTKLCSSIILQIHIWVVSSLGLLQVKLPWTFLYTSVLFCIGFFCNMLSCLLGKTLRNGMKHFLNVCLTYTCCLPYVLIFLFFFSPSLCTVIQELLRVISWRLTTYTKFLFQWLHFHFQDFSFISFLNLLVFLSSILFLGCLK